MFDYADMAQTAAEMLEEFGAPVVLQRPTDELYDPASGDVTGSIENRTGTAARIEYVVRDIDGDLIRSGDFRLLMSVYTRTGGQMPQPRTDDRLLFDTEWINVVRCDPVKPATIAVVYEVQARN